MISSRILYSFLSLLLVTAPGFSAVPPTQAPHYEQALPGYQYHFPRDHAAHPSYKTEWWYYTGHLKNKHGRTFGYELTFFRIGTGIAPIRHQGGKKSPWSMDELYMAHFALTDDQGGQFFNTETLNRGGLNTARADNHTYHVVNKGWQVKQIGQDKFELFVQSGEQALHLNLKAEKPLVIHGKNGISQKADCVGCASHYYSYTRLLSEGTLTWKGAKFPVQGHTWMDHEFGSNQLTTQQVGWDWFSVQLDDNSELMLYSLRQKNGHIDPNSSGTWVSAQGNASHLKKSQFQTKPLAYWKSSKTGGVYPSGWQVLVPEEGLDLQITPTVRKQELVSPTPGGTSYWEGRCLVNGIHNGKKVNGEAYVELTGYSKAFKQRI